MLGARNGVVTRMCSVPTYMTFRIYTCLKTVQLSFTLRVSIHIYSFFIQKKKRKEKKKKERKKGKTKLQSILITMDSHNSPN